MSQQWDWKASTGPFSAVGDPRAPARFILEQVGDSSFGIPNLGPNGPSVGFQVNPNVLDPGSSAPVKVIDHSNLADTDLASVPVFLKWFVGSYGRHTPAALVHDERITNSTPFDEATRADRQMFDLMTASGVLPVRRWAMWAAITVRTRWKSGLPRCAGVLAWAAIAICGMCMLVRGLGESDWWRLLVSLLLQVPASVFWGRSWRLGIVAGYALPVAVIPAAASGAGYLAYLGAEWIGIAGRALLRRDRKLLKEKVVRYKDL